MEPNQPVEEKKYPCLYDLKDDCKARRLVEEPPQQIDASPGSSEEERTVENALGNGTKGLRFDDMETARKIGDAVAKGSAKIFATVMFRDKTQPMCHFCSMCPALMEKLSIIRITEWRLLEQERKK